MSSYSAEDLVRLVQEEVAQVLAFATTLSRRTGLGHSEMAALEHLQRAAEGGAEGGAGGLTPTRLGRQLGLSSGAVTALVDRLERAGYVERRPNPEDRRSSVVYPKPEGLEDAARHLHSLREDLLEATAWLTEEQRAAVGAYLAEISVIFARHAQGGSVPGGDPRRAGPPAPG